MSDQPKCQDCGQTGHLWWECRDPQVLAKRQNYWPSRKINADSFDDDADELKFAANERDVFD